MSEKQDRKKIEKNPTLTPTRRPSPTIKTIKNFGKEVKLIKQGLFYYKIHK